MKKSKNVKCTDTTRIFVKLFKGYYPNFSDSESAYENIQGNSNSFSRKCSTQIYNVGECSNILTKISLKSNPYGDNIENYWGKNIQVIIIKENQTIIMIIVQIKFNQQKEPYVYDNTEVVEYLINKYNKKFEKEID